jgi:hypothetical protein
MVSVHGITSELRPILRMTVPRGVRALSDLEVVPGQRLFRSWFLLFGVIPAGYSDLTLLELSSGSGFVEQSPMSGVRLWRHERQVRENAAGGCRLTDRVTVEPMFAPALTRGVVTSIFEHRHRVLRRRFGNAEDRTPALRQR